MWPPGPIGGPWPNGDPGMPPNCGPKPGGFGPPPGKWGGGPPPPLNAGPELLGRPNWDGDPKAPPPGPPPWMWPGGPAEFGGCGNPAPLTFWGGPGPGVDDPEGAGEAVYCGVLLPGGGPPWTNGGIRVRSLTLRWKAGWPCEFTCENMTGGPPPPPPPPPALPAGDAWPTGGKTGPPAKELGPVGVKPPELLPPAEPGMEF